MAIAQWTLSAQMTIVVGTAAAVVSAVTTARLGLHRRHSHPWLIPKVRRDDDQALTLAQVATACRDALVEWRLEVMDRCAVGDAMPQTGEAGV